MSILSIGKAVKAILLADTSLTAMIEENVSPVVSDEGTTFPLINYRRSSSEQMHSKDSRYEESAQVELVIAAVTYPSSLQIAEQVTQTLTSFRGVVSEFNIKKINLRSSSERYDFSSGGVFIQTLIFNIYVNS